MKKYPSFYNSNALLVCAYDEDNHILLLVKFDENSGEILNSIVYSKKWTRSHYRLQNLTYKYNLGS